MIPRRSFLKATLGVLAGIGVVKPKTTLLSVQEGTLRPGWAPWIEPIPEFARISNGVYFERTDEPWNFSYLDPIDPGIRPDHPAVHDSR